MDAPPLSLPRRVLPGPSRTTVHDSRASRAIEADALGRHAPHVLMQRAGLAVARLALAVAPHAQRIWVAAGPGNNGGDGLVAALHLHRGGRNVHVTLLGDPDRAPADAAQALAEARGAGVTVSAEWPTLPPELTIDALLGLGSTRAPLGALADAVGRLNTAGAPCLAVDLPTGLNADTGCRLGSAAVRATHTLALLTLKPGLLTADGRDLAGELWLDTLGVDTTSQSATAQLTSAEDLRDALPARPHASHKGRFGDVAVVGGAAGMTGAAVLAARAALASGAGRVFVDLLGDPALALDPTRPELMWRPGWWRSPAPVLQHSTVVCGCGGGQAIADTLPALLSRSPRLVLDADALNRLAVDPGLQSLLRQRSARGLASVLTPHPLEAARLLERSAESVQADRLGAARELAGRLGSVVLLKGSGSVVATPDGRCAINGTGNALLAGAGSGDVLAGWIGGLWAQQAPGDAHAAERATRAAAWLHGHAADRQRARGGASPVLPAADLIAAMSDALGR